MWQVELRYFDYGLGKMRVQIMKQNVDRSIISAHFNEDLSSLSDDELIEKTLESFYAETYVGRFAKEQDTKLAILDEKLKEAERFMEESRAEMNRMSVEFTTMLSTLFESNAEDEEAEVEIEAGESDGSHE